MGKACPVANTTHTSSDFAVHLKKLTIKLNRQYLT